jgi:AraC-like DNA-binding protein
MTMPHPPPPRGDRLRLAYLYGGTVQYQPGESLGPRLLADFELVLLAEGRVLYRSGGQAHRLAPGSVVLARPGAREEYVWDPRGRTRHAYFHFGIEYVPRGWPPASKWPAVRLHPPPLAAALFREILERSHERSGAPAARPPPLEERLVETLIELLLEPRRRRAPDEADARPEPVARAIKLMRRVLEEEPGRALGLAAVARRAGVTEKHLCRVFRASVGHAPMETFRLLRLQLALALLMRSGLAVKEIAARCGFEDPLYFSRCFSRAFRRSPRKVREDLRRGRAPPPSPLPVDITPRVNW